jgi:cytochrome P450
MLMGGIDTSSTVLEWLMAKLTKNPSSMKRAQEEARRVVGKKSKIYVNDINKMDYLNCPQRIKNLYDCTYHFLLWYLGKQ